MKRTSFLLIGVIVAELLTGCTSSSKANELAKKNEELQKQVDSLQSKADNKDSKSANTTNTKLTKEEVIKLVWAYDTAAFASKNVRPSDCVEVGNEAILNKDSDCIFKDSDQYYGRDYYLCVPKGGNMLAYAVDAYNGKVFKAVDYIANDKKHVLKLIDSVIPNNALTNQNPNSNQNTMANSENSTNLQNQINNNQSSIINSPYQIQVSNYNVKNNVIEINLTYRNNDSRSILVGAYNFILKKQGVNAIKGDTMMALSKTYGGIQDYQKIELLEIYPQDNYTLKVLFLITRDETPSGFTLYYDEGLGKLAPITTLK